jgi:MOSC domain-containing protein YiiM
MNVRYLFISPGHNYVGHHGQPAGAHLAVAVEQVECVAGRGLRGDRFLDHGRDYKGQVTFFAMEVVEAMTRDLRLTDARPELTRRNVFTRGANLQALVGVEFEIQGVRFAGTEECRPCHWMNEAFGDDRVEAWLEGRGGLRARILTDGVLKVAT